MAPSYVIKSMAGFSRNGEKGFEGALTLLQMQTYVTVRGFTRKQSRSGEYYGWHIAVYSRTEHKFGRDFAEGAYRIGPAASKEKLVGQLMKINPGIRHNDAENFLR